MADSWKDMTAADVHARNARIASWHSPVVRVGDIPGSRLGPDVIVEPLNLPKPAKYRNKKTWCGGILFDSGHEADRWQQLAALQELGQIRDLELQPRFGIFVCEMASGRGIEVASFKADFRYFDVEQNRVRVEDAKSDVTKHETAFSLRKKLVEACHGIEIECV